MLGTYSIYRTFCDFELVVQRISYNVFLEVRNGIRIYFRRLKEVVAMRRWEEVYRKVSAYLAQATFVNVNTVRGTPE